MEKRTHHSLQNAFKQVIVVGSGKGGVGKSTVAINLAVALAQQSLSIGILDADLYGPSLPIMLGLRGIPPRVFHDQEEERIHPFEKFGLQAISLGCFLEEGRSVVWRGPMLHAALQRLLSQVAWKNLDILIIDLPPGTGDILVSLAQLLPIRGALAVTTPQDVAIVDVLKAIDAFDKLKIPLLGIIENMSRFITPKGEHFFPFGEGKTSLFAERLKVPLLQTFPFLTSIREGSDAGIPAAFYPQSEAGTPFTELAWNVLSILR